MLNSLLTIILFGVSGVAYFEYSMDNTQEYAKPVLLKSYYNIKSAVIATPRPRAVKKEAKIHTSKIKIDRTSKYIMIGSAQNEEGWIAMVSLNGKSRILMIGENEGNVFVTNVTKDSLKIEGYKEIIKAKNKTVNRSKSRTVKKPSVSLAPSIVIKNKITSHVQAHKKSSTVNTRGLEINNKKKKTYKLLRNVLKDIKLDPKKLSQYLWVTFKDGKLMIGPRSNHKDVFFKLGFRIGDEIVAINGEKISSLKNVYFEINKVLTSKTVAITVSNSGAERQVSINLMQMYKF